MVHKVGFFMVFIRPQIAGVNSVAWQLVSGCRFFLLGSLYVSQSPSFTQALARSDGNERRWFARLVCLLNGQDWYVADSARQQLPETTNDPILKSAPPTRPQTLYCAAVRVVVCGVQLGSRGANFSITVFICITNASPGCGTHQRRRKRGDLTWNRDLG